MPKDAFTFGAEQKSLRVLKSAYQSYLDRGYDPVESCEIVYDRAICFYDSVFVEDEMQFRQKLVNRRNKVFESAVKLRAKEIEEND